MTFLHNLDAQPVASSSVSLGVDALDAWAAETYVAAGGCRPDQDLHEPPPMTYLHDLDAQPVASPRGSRGLAAMDAWAAETAAVAGPVDQRRVDATDTEILAHSGKLNSEFVMSVARAFVSGMSKGQRADAIRAASNDDESIVSRLNKTAAVASTFSLADLQQYKDDCAVLRNGCQPDVVHYLRSSTSELTERDLDQAVLRGFYNEVVLALERDTAMTYCPSAEPDRHIHRLRRDELLRAVARAAKRLRKVVDAARAAGLLPQSMVGESEYASRLMSRYAYAEDGHCVAERLAKRARTSSE